MKTFRHWVAAIWYEHQEELMVWGQRAPDYTAQQYFRKYKWWLWRQYKRECQNATGVDKTGKT